MQMNSLLFEIRYHFSLRRAKFPKPANCKQAHAISCDCEPIFKCFSLIKQNKNQHFLIPVVAQFKMCAME